jgi:energy-coupling factor transporter ATP-binding protein EcfA2
MITDSERSDIQGQLENALETGLIPDEGKRRAAQVLSRLDTPVRVVVVGRPGAGKSNLINMLSGQVVIPSGADLPPVEVTFGPQPRTIYLRSDGSQKENAGLHLDTPPPAETSIIRVEIPLDGLRHLTLTELDLRGGHQEQKAIAEWATGRADIVLWCSQVFDTAEQSLWAPAPDKLKDHSFLVVTKADRLENQGILSARISELSEIVAEEFYRMYPVATRQAISAFSPNGARDEDLWTSSGGNALANAVKALVDTGRRADRDNALAFLSRYAPDVTIPAAKPKMAQRVEPQPDNPPDLPANDTATSTFRQALTMLEERADLMLGVVAGSRADKPMLVLDHCLETADRLSEIVMELESPQSPFLELQEDIMECSDMMVLFHLEKTEDAATDAVTLLLQLKKEMSLAVAA